MTTHSGCVVKELEVFKDIDYLLIQIEINSSQEKVQTLCCEMDVQNYIKSLTELEKCVEYKDFIKTVRFSNTISKQDLKKYLEQGKVSVMKVLDNIVY